MYYSYTGGRNLYGELTADTSATNLTNGDLFINSGIGKILNMRSWPFLYREGTVATVANIQFIEIPANIKKVTGVKVTSGTTEWTPREAPDYEFWARLNYTVATAYTADYPNWYYPFNGRVYLYPTPSTARTVTVFGRVGFGRLNIADYTTGNAIATFNSTAVTGSGTSWTNSMSGRFIRFTASDTASTGDDEWYEISTVDSATALTLKKPYLGRTISPAAPYAIGQMSRIPDGYQEAPIYWGAHLYWSFKGLTGAAAKAVAFKKLYDETVEQLISDYGSATDNIIVEEASLDDQINPNLIVRT